MSAEQLFQDLVGGDRTALAKAITLVESNLEKHKTLSDELLRKAINLNRSSLRIGITGVPGVGKSTFINFFGAWLVKEKGKKVAVLAIDPSSNQSHGSILGDKTRMEDLTNLQDVFIRPTPAGGYLGGIARKTRESILLCEAAGFDTVFVETVGVGQSEYLADQVVDCLLLLMLPNAGDQLQGIKRGIMELADIVVVNKAGVTDKSILNQSISDIKQAVHLLPNKSQGWMPEVFKNNLNSAEDFSNIWLGIEKFIQHQNENKGFLEKRSRQNSEWLNNRLKQKLEEMLLGNPNMQKIIEQNSQRWIEEGWSISKMVETLIKEWQKSTE